LTRERQGKSIGYIDAILRSERDKKQVAKEPDYDHADDERYRAAVRREGVDV
jgi:hypothetical protein